MILVRMIEGVSGLADFARRIERMPAGRAGPRHRAAPAA
jgi:hypothetical protein